MTLTAWLDEDGKIAISNGIFGLSLSPEDLRRVLDELAPVADASGETRKVPVETEMWRAVCDGLVIQIGAMLKAIDAVAPEVRVGVHPAFNHLARMAQAMRNYIEAEGEALP